MSLLILLLKVSLLFILALTSLPLMRRATAAMRHLLCAIALSGALLLPLTLVFTPGAIPIRVPVVFIGSAASVTGTATGFPLSRALVALWAIGTFCLLLRLALGHYRIRRVLRNAERTADRAPVYLADVSAPLICGVFDTAILLPRSSPSWPAEQRVAALRHELAHMQRKDLLTSLIAHIVCAVYWFHPLVWAVARQLREEQESACDDVVLATGFEPATYAEALVATAQQLTSTSLIGCHMLTSQTLKSRIARLLDRSLPRTSSTAARSRTAILSVALLAVIGLTYAQPPQPAKDEKVYKMGTGITAPHVVSKVEPQYTEEARAAKIEGPVILSIVVGTDGVAHDINVVSTPDSGLGIKAAEAVQEWKFAPATKDGETVAVRAQIEINFKLL